VIKARWRGFTCLRRLRGFFLKLLEMVSGRKVSKVIVAYEDRLTWFGFETLRKLFSSFGTEIEVINREEKTPKEELVEDLITNGFPPRWEALRVEKPQV